MTKRDLAAIGVRLLAVWALLYSLASISQSLSSHYIRHSGLTLPPFMDALTAATIFGPCLVLWGVAWTLWARAEALADSLSGTNGDVLPLVTNISARDVFTAVLCASGVYLAASSVVPLFGSLFHLLLALAPSVLGYAETTSFPLGFAVVGAVSPLAQTVVGAFLFKRAPAIANRLFPAPAPATSALVPAETPDTAQRLPSP